MSFPFLHFTIAVNVTMHHICVCAGTLLKEAAAKPVPRAAHGVPHPAVPQARREGEGDSEQGYQQVAQAQVDQEEVGGRAQSRELGVEKQHQQVAADAQQREAAE